MSDFSRGTKSEIRARLLAARRSRPDRAAADAAVRHLLAGLATGLGTVAGYVPLATEPGGAALPEVLAAACHRLIVPVTLPDRDLDWMRYDTGADQPAPPPGEPPGEPPAGSPALLGPAAIGTADLIIVPAVAVDRAGIRLGRGGGSYDRALARVPAGTPIVAALYHDEFVEALPFEPHDRRVGAVVTPYGITRL